MEERRQVEAIEFRAVAPKRPLPGLDDALVKLERLGTELDLINGKLAGLSTQSGLKNTAKQMEQMLKSNPLTKSLGKISPTQAARVLGVPDEKDFEQFIARFKASNRVRAKTMFSGDDFASPRQAAEVTRKWFLSAEKEVEGRMSRLQTLLGQGFTSPEMKHATGALTSGEVPLIVPADRILATLGPGRIPLLINPERMSGAGGSGVSGAGGQGSGLKGKSIGTVASAISSGDKKAMQRAVADILAAAELEATQLSARGAIRKDSRGSVLGLGKIADTVETTVLGDGGADKLKAAGLGNLAVRAAKLAEASRKKAEDIMFREMQATGEIREAMARAAATGNKEEAARLKKQFNDQERNRKALEREAAQNTRIAQSELKQRATSAQSVGRFQSARTKGEDAMAAARAKTAAFEAQQFGDQIRLRVSTESAEKRLQQMRQAGAQLTTRNVQEVGTGGRLVTRRQTTATLDENGLRTTVTATFSQTRARLEETTKAIRETSAATQTLGANFVDNTIKVTRWAASVALLYKGMELAGHSVARFVEIQSQMARLDQVFSHLGGSTMELTSDILHLAAANGRSTQEAMESAIEWSRLGLSRLQVNEAVRVSLMAANVAELSAADATEKLQGVYQNYGLRIGQLASVLGMLNQISNTYNVTNADMLQGLEKTAAVARQAGLPLAELMGLIGATVGQTAQTGGNIGTAIKSMVLGLSNPAMQEKLRKNFRFEASTGGEEIKDMSRMLSDLFVKYQHLNEAQRQAMLFTVGGRTQGSRLEAMLDNYVRAQTLAINAQLNLNSAEKENEKILATLKAQLVGLSGEWEKFVVLQGSRGPVQAITEMSVAMRNLLRIVNSPGMSVLTTGILGVSMAAGMKTLIAGMGMRAGGTFLSRTGSRLAQEMKGLNTAAMLTVAGFLGNRMPGPPQPTGFYGGYRSSVINTRPSRNPWANLNTPFGLNPLTWGKSAVEPAVTGIERWTQGMKNAGPATMLFARSLQMGLIAIGEWIAPLLAVYGAIKLFNFGMEKMGLSSEEAERKMAGFNRQAEAAQGAAGAFAEAADLLLTAQKSLGSEKGFQGISMENARKLNAQLAESSFSDIADPDKRKRMAESFQKETDALIVQGNLVAVIAKYEERRNELLQARREKLMEAFRIQGDSKQRAEEELARLKKIQNSTLGALGGESRKGRIAELEGQISQLDDSRTRNLMQQSEALEHQIELTQKYQTELERQRLTFETIGEIYNSIATSNPLERALVKRSSLQAQAQSARQFMNTLDIEDEGDLAGQSKRKNRVDEIDKKIESANAIMRGIENTMPKAVPGEVGYEQIQANLSRKPEYVSAKNDLGNLLDERENAKRGILREGELGFATRQKLRENAFEEAQKRDREAAALTNRMPLIEQQTRFGFGQAEGKREFDRNDFGVDQTDKFLRQYYRLQKETAPKDTSNLDITQRASLLEKERQMQETILNLRERAATVERDINQLYLERSREFRRNVLGGGPEQLLRTLAAFRTAFDRNGNQQNVSAGSLLAMSPEFRGSVTGAQAFGVSQGKQMPPGAVFWDPAMMDLLNERKRLMSGGFGSDNGASLDDAQLRLSQQIGKLADTLKDALPADALAAGAELMGRFNDKLGDSIGALETFAKRLLLAIPAVPREKLVVPQGGGLGAGAGFHR